MREILFRGKRIDNGEWVYGLPSYDESYYITSIENNHEYTDFVDVVEETVSQFTGFYDKNGTKIFEGDILEMHYDDLFPENTSKSTVAFHNGAWELKNHYDMGWKGRMETFDSRRSKVIDNIYDGEDAQDEIN